MKRKTGKKLLGVLLTLAMVIGLMPGMSLTALADTTDIGVGTTWYIGDSFNLAGKYVNPSERTGHHPDCYPLRKWGKNSCSEVS